MLTAIAHYQLSYKKRRGYLRMDLGNASLIVKLVFNKEKNQENGQKRENVGI